MVTVLPSYLGMLAPLLQPSTLKKFSKSSHPPSTHYLIVIAAFCDFLGSILTAIGLFYTGSGLYQVLYSSVVIFTAVLCKIFLDKPLSTRQWISVVLVSFGLALSAGSKNEDVSDAASLIIGSIFVILGTILVASAYVIDQKVIGDNLAESDELCYLTGCYSTIFTLLYFLIYTIPRFDILITSEVDRLNGSWNQIIITFLALVVINWLHNYCYFAVVEKVGSVKIGILQSLRAILVFFFSALLFCNTHSEQCFTFYKGISSCIVIGSVLLFIMSPYRPPRPKTYTV